jgi:hypothetical protein
MKFHDSCVFCGSRNIESIPYNNSGPLADKIFDGLEVGVCNGCKSSFVLSPPRLGELL